MTSTSKCYGQSSHAHSSCGARVRCYYLLTLEEHCTQRKLVVDDQDVSMVSRHSSAPQAKPSRLYKKYHSATRESRRDCKQWLCCCTSNRCCPSHHASAKRCGSLRWRNQQWVGGWVGGGAKVVSTCEQQESPTEFECVNSTRYAP